MRIALLAFVVFGMASAATAHAQMISIRDQAEVDVKGSRPTAEVKAQARALAVENAWKRYQAQNASGARAVAFIRFAGEMRSQRDLYCTFNFYEDFFNKEAKTYSVRVNASCDQRAIDAALNQLVSGNPEVARGGGEPITFLFLARRAYRSTQQDDRVVKRSTQKAEVSTSDEDIDAEAAFETDDYSVGAATSGVTVSQSQSVTTESSGSTVSEDADFRWRGEQADSLDGAVSNVLNTAGFGVTPYASVLGYCPGPTPEEVMEGLVDPAGNQSQLVPPATFVAMVQAAKDCDQALFAIGVVDILKSRREADRLWAVTVAVRIEVHDVRKKLPVKIASIPSVQYQQKAPDRIEAANAAMAMAAESATREIVDLLRNRGF